MQTLFMLVYMFCMGLGSKAQAEQLRVQPHSSISFQVNAPGLRDLIIDNPTGNVLIKESSDDDVHFIAQYDGDEEGLFEVNGSTGLLRVTAVPPRRDSQVLRLPPGGIVIDRVSSDLDIKSYFTQDGGSARHTSAVHDLIVGDFEIWGTSTHGYSLRLKDPAPFRVIEGKGVTHVVGNALHLFLAVPPGLLKDLDVSSQLGKVQVEGAFKNEVAEQRRVTLRSVFGEVRTEHLRALRTNMRTTFSGVTVFGGSGIVHAVVERKGDVTIEKHESTAVSAVTSEGHIRLDNPLALDTFATTLKGNVFRCGNILATDPKKL